MTKRKRRALIDVDGVCCDFIGGALATIERVTGRPPPADVLEDWDMFRSYEGEEKKAIYAAFEEKDWCYSLEVLPGAYDGIRRLQLMGVDVYFVTAPWNSRHWAYERTAWLQMHFGVNRNQVIHTNAKHVCVGDVFVDDKYEHILDWKEHHPAGVPILWSAPYNVRQNYEIRTNSWEFVLECAVG